MVSYVLPFCSIFFSEHYVSLYPIPEGRASKKEAATSGFPVAAL
jgi:hypothetical protein